MKKFVSVLLTLVMLLSAVVASADFTDVSATSRFSTAIAVLSEKEILNGYEDGSFRPKGDITRSEVAAVIARAMELDITATFQQTYTDVQPDNWYYGYVMAASHAGILNGMGDGVFDPYNNVTHHQILKIIVCMMNLQDQANENGGWPNGYAYVAHEKGVINDATYRMLNESDYGSCSASRGVVATYVYNGLFADHSTPKTEEDLVRETVENYCDAAIQMEFNIAASFSTNEPEEISGESFKDLMIQELTGILLPEYPEESMQFAQAYIKTSCDTADYEITGIQKQADNSYLVSLTETRLDDTKVFSELMENLDYDKILESLLMNEKVTEDISRDEMEALTYPYTLKEMARVIGSHRFSTVTDELELKVIFDGTNWLVDMSE